MSDPTGFATANNYGDDYAQTEFMVQQLQGRMATATICKVVAIAQGADDSVSPVGLVDLQPIVQQMSGAGLGVSHGIIHNVPYVRVQGGVNAVIIDPKVGDIGIAIFCSHDITKVKSTKSESPPGSRRRFDWGDALYMGGILNGTPENYIQFDSNGDIRLKPASKVYITGDLEVTGEVTGNGIPLSTHKHGGVQTGSGDTGGPHT